MVKYRMTTEEEFSQGRLHSCAGKASGPLCNWWNIQNPETGVIMPTDLGKMDKLQKVDELVKNEAEVEVVYVTLIPHYLHNDTNCYEAKMKELKQWDAYGVYEEVDDEGQFALGTDWIMAKKGDGVKGRFIFRGDQDPDTSFRTDYPTVKKGYMKIVTTIGDQKGWKIKSSDVRGAFLQDMPMTRDVFIKPPKERRMPEILWKLVKPVYGLSDAPRGWHRRGEESQSVGSSQQGGTEGVQVGGGQTSQREQQESSRRLL